MSNTSVKIVAVKSAPSAASRCAVTGRLGAKQITAKVGRKTFEIGVAEALTDSLTPEQIAAKGVVIKGSYKKPRKLNGKQNAEARKMAEVRGRQIGTRGRLSKEDIEFYRNHGKIIRDWAAQKGIEVPARGRLSDEVKNAYFAAVKA